MTLKRRLSERQWVGKWEDPFDWLEDDDTMYSGKTMVNGRSCDLWTNTDSHGWVESLAAQGNTPVQWNVSNHYLNFFESITYGTDFKPGPSPPSVFSIAPSCYNGGAICELNFFPSSSPLVHSFIHSFDRHFQETKLTAMNKRSRWNNRQYHDDQISSHR